MVSDSTLQLTLKKLPLVVLAYLHGSMDFLGGSVVMNLPVMQETQEMQVQSLGQEDPLEEVWQPTPVFLPGESHGQRSLEGYSPCGSKESNTTEAT